MKNLLLTLLGFIVSFVFTGCFHYQINFDQKFVEYESVEYITNKNKNLDVAIKDLDFYLIEKKPTSLIAGRANYIGLTDSLNEQLLSSVLNQYFTNVSISTLNNHTLFIESKILDFDWEPIWMGQKNTFLIQVVVYYKGKEILNKIYSELYDKAYIIETLNMSEISSYIISKNIFKLYQTKFIPDLAKALKENQ